jgi:hypothetical protein
MEYVLMIEPFLWWLALSDIGDDGDALTAHAVFIQPKKRLTTPGLSRPVPE